MRRRKQAADPLHQEHEQATDLLHVNLRLRRDLHRQLEDAAKRRNATLSNEIRWRLEDTFKSDTVRGFEEIRYDMEICWARFSARLLRIDLENELAEELARTNDPKIRTLAKLWLDHRAVEQRQPKGGV